VSKNKLGLRRSSGSKPKNPRVGGVATGRAGGLAPGMNVERPYLPDSEQDSNRDLKTRRVDPGR
jgi:hypothetical protein